MSPQTTTFCPAQDFKKLMDDISGKAHILRLQAKGGSMYPFIRSGDLVEASLLKQDEALQKGDVILFEKDGYFYVHRVIKIKRGFVVARGDLSFGEDGCIRRENIIAKVVAVERRGKRIDLYTPLNRFVAQTLVVNYVFFQYASVVVSKFVSVVFRLLSGFQRFGVSRMLLKKIISPKIVITRATEADREFLRDLYCVTLPDIDQGMLATEKEGVWLVARWGEKIAGSIVISRHGSGNKFWLTHGLVVKPLVRGLGIAQKLLLRAVLEARIEGAERIGLFVSKSNRAAVNLYQKNGFKTSQDYPRDFNVEETDCYLVYETSK